MVVKANVFPVFMYGRESWTINKAERRRIDGFDFSTFRLSPSLIFPRLTFLYLKRAFIPLTKHREGASSRHGIKFKQALSPDDQDTLCLDPALSPTAPRHRPMDPDTLLSSPLSPHTFLLPCFHSHSLPHSE